MPLSDTSFDLAALPRVHDKHRAEQGVERWLERARGLSSPELKGFAVELAADPAGRALLGALFVHSPFLSDLALAEPGIVRGILVKGPGLMIDMVLADLEREAGAEEDTGRCMQALRLARRRVALLVALADMTGNWPLEIVTMTLSRFADMAINLAARHLLRRAALQGELVLPDPALPERGSGLVILGMGKLGANELNYSSDIDLIVLFDRDRIDYRGRRSVQDCFVRIARDLVRMLQERTEIGYVFRTDLRLRPDPGSTPLALSVIAAETYYEGMGQNWERAAMIKARAVAGDLEAGRLFLKALKPFIWRKHLDFAAIQDIHSIKRQIHAVKGFRDIAVAGHNIKLGRGGIREVEFFAQTQQLIWGGRNPELRAAATCPAIRALTAAGRVAPEAAEDLIGAYRYLRMVEHRLQMVDDRQTQTLPGEGPELEALAAFCGEASLDDFKARLLEQLGLVEDHYAELFEEAPSLSGPGNLVFTGAKNDPDTVRTLSEMGFADGASIATVIRAWHTGRYRATRSTRARELLTELMPALLTALAHTPQPDAAFTRFDAFLSGLPAGVQLFSLLHAHPELLQLIAEVMGGAPLLAERLGARPALLDAVLSRDFFKPLPPQTDLAIEFAHALEQGNDLQDRLDIARRWAKDRQFQAGLLILHHRLDDEAAGRTLSDIAEVAIAGLTPHVEAEFEHQHGKMPGRGLATVALGKLGGRELSVTSDLDLIFLYDLPADQEANPPLSDGPKPLAPIHYFARLAQRHIGALNAPTAEGKLFEVDMRLRPSGNAGPIASSLASFLRYQSLDAWTWEHMALTRARVILGEPSFVAEIEAGLRGLLSRPRDPEKLKADIVDMRRRIAQQHRTDREWDVKYRRGGLIDIEFLAQYLELRHAAEHPDVISANTAAAIAALAKAGLLAAADAAALGEALTLWRRLQGFLRLTIGQEFDEAALPEGIKRALAAAAHLPDFASLKSQMAERAEAAALVHERLLGRA
ncbi:glutamate-ammonia-ligase adenylyltransferase [Hypericibacter adhaerens]|uniref:Bifunctional glutamine synthetase adenylyltransferase/adenylyl-removing enzyme n=1 Tax=Hypericibacter adhaerens TaxID=2602016 RepID=A0A5J6MW87_9PROT|nr:bifunctional [glutamine synthetase] adenylyltransferase/[glutamine synthetase]-adenylyl-L-tyrosine phosphorylase [Hypericibacter adhaerens]QEX21521.1 glutamate-ammonia-ligase adenylyltransferase [Hypericibacter adhaerens]